MEIKLLEGFLLFLFFFFYAYNIFCVTSRCLSFSRCLPITYLYYCIFVFLDCKNLRIDVNFTIVQLNLTLVECKSLWKIPHLYVLVKNVKEYKHTKMGCMDYTKWGYSFPLPLHIIKAPLNNMYAKIRYRCLYSC